MASEKREEGGEEQFERLGAVAESYRSKRESFYSQKKKNSERGKKNSTKGPAADFPSQKNVFKIGFRKENLLEAAASTTTCG